MSARSAASSPAEVTAALDRQVDPYLRVLAAADAWVAEGHADDGELAGALIELACHDSTWGVDELGAISDDVYRLAWLAFVRAVALEPTRWVASEQQLRHVHEDGKHLFDLIGALADLELARGGEVAVTEQVMALDGAALRARVVGDLRIVRPDEAAWHAQGELRRRRQTAPVFMLADPPAAIRARVVDLVDDGDLEPVLATLCELVLADPCDLELRLRRGEAACALGRPAVALLDAEASTRRWPGWLAGYRLRAHALHGLGRTPEALVDLVFAFAFVPKDDALWEQVTEDLSALLEVGGAAAMCWPPEVDDPATHRAHQLIEHLIKLDDDSRCEEFLQHLGLAFGAPTAWPEHWCTDWMLARRATAALRREHFAAAREAQEMIVARYPQAVIHRLNLADTLLILDEPQTVLELLDGVAPRDAGHAAYAAELRGRALVSIGRVEDALHEAERGLRFGRAAGHQLLDLAGGCHSAMRRPELAVIAFSQAIDLAGDEPVLYLRRAVELTRLGRADDAVADLRHVLQLDPEAVGDLRADQRLDALRTSGRLDALLAEYGA